MLVNENPADAVGSRRIHMRKYQYFGLNFIVHVNGRKIRFV
jgi:hypothetical protein